MAERIINIPNSLAVRARERVDQSIPTSELRREAAEGARLVTGVAADYKTLMDILDKDPLGVELGKIISQAYRYSQREDGVDVVRFVTSGCVANPVRIGLMDQHTNGLKGSQNYLQIATIRNTTLDSEDQIGRIGSPLGVLISKIRDEMWVDYSSVDGLLKQLHGTDRLGQEQQEIEISDYKLIALQRAYRVVESCFLEEEINQQGGIIQALIDQVA
jgi:hypothetical protein